MTNILFPKGSFIGFEDLFKQIEGASVQANDQYPPHNIVKYSENMYGIELAVAGFTQQDIDIECDAKTLYIRGKNNTADSVAKKEYVHRGISQKKFIRTFRLAEHIQVSSAELTDGILTIMLELVIPENLKPRKIEITKPQLLVE
jgi:molecular chaperone IbpA